MPVTGLGSDSGGNAYIAKSRRPIAAGSSFGAGPLNLINPPGSIGNAYIAKSRRPIITGAANGPFTPSVAIASNIADIVGAELLLVFGLGLGSVFASDHRQRAPFPAYPPARIVTSEPARPDPGSTFATQPYLRGNPPLLKPATLASVESPRPEAGSVYFTHSPYIAPFPNYPLAHYAIAESPQPGQGAYFATLPPYVQPSPTWKRATLASSEEPRPEGGSIVYTRPPYLAPLPTYRFATYASAESPIPDPWPGRAYATRGGISSIPPNVQTARAILTPWEPPRPEQGSLYRWPLSYQAPFPVFLAPVFAIAETPQPSAGIAAYTAYALPFAVPTGPVPFHPYVEPRAVTRFPANTRILLVDPTAVSQATKPFEPRAARLVAEPEDFNVDPRRVILVK